MSTLVLIAWRSLVRNRRRSLFVVAALVVGLTAITTMRSYLNAMHRAQLENQLKGRYGHLQIHKKGFMANVLVNPLQFNFEDSEALRDRIAAVRGVVGVAPRIGFSGMYSGPELVDKPARTAFFSMMAIDPLAETIVSPKLYENISDGRMIRDADSRELVLNVQLARGLDAVVAPDDDPPPEAEWPVILTSDVEGSMNGEIAVVVGHLVATMPGDNRYGLMALGAAQRLLRLDNRVTEYAIAVADLDAVPRIQRELQSSLGEDFEVHRWDEVVPMLRQLLQATSTLFNIVTGIFLTVIFLGLVNVMLMNVMERVREIGTMMSVGTRRNTILSLFVIEGATVGLVGGAVGLLLGTLIVAWLNQRGVRIAPPGNESPLLLRPFVTPAFLAAMELFAVGGSVVASLWPAWKASRLNPVEALHTI